MLILDGKEVAMARRRVIGERAARFSARNGRKPGLAMILVGEDPASQVYVRGKIKACAEAGIASFEYMVPADIGREGLRARIESLNEDPKVDGILLQLPLPKSAGVDSREALQWIHPSKDADCLTAENLGRLWTGRPLTIPCTPAGVMAILEHYKIPVAGLHAVVIGRSNIVGKPMAHLLVQADATVTVCHSKTRELSDFTRLADLVVVAAGQPEFVGGDYFHAGAIVVDVGIHRRPGKDGKDRLCGDVRWNEIRGLVKAATPVPGGVGPMTITMLLENTLRLAEANVP